MQRQYGGGEESQRALKRVRTGPILHYHDELKRIDLETFENRVALVKEHRELTHQEVTFVRRSIRLLKNRAESKMSRQRRIQVFNEMQLKIQRLEEEVAALRKKQQPIPESVVVNDPSISPTLIVSNVFLDMIEWF